MALREVMAVKVAVKMAVKRGVKMAVKRGVKKASNLALVIANAEGELSVGVALSRCLPKPVRCTHTRHTPPYVSIREDT